MFDSAGNITRWLRGKHPPPFSDPMPSRLAQLEINDLFGLYSHRIHLNQSERITIIIGPNGRGKTVCLKLIEALYKKRFRYFADIPYSSVVFSFDKGEKITINQQPAEEKSAGSIPSRTISFSIEIPGQELAVWKPRQFNKSFDRELRRFIPVQWHQTDYDTWEDQTDGEQLNLEALLRRFPVPAKFLETLELKAPPELDAILKGVDCHLIETQRLLVLPPDALEEEFDYPYRVRRRSAQQNVLAVRGKAQALRDILKTILSRSANVSAQLDRSFPIRVLSGIVDPVERQFEFGQLLAKHLDFASDPRPAMQQPLGEVGIPFLWFGHKHHLGHPTPLRTRLPPT